MKNYSFIIVHHNIPSLLKRCIDSIPFREDVEIIIVDDCSDKEFVDFDHFPGAAREDTKCVFLSKNCGPGYARNSGLSKASGKWVIFSDADDFFNEGALSFLDKYVDSANDVILFKTTSCYSDNTLVSANRDYYNRYIDDYNAGVLDAQRMVFLSCSSWAKMIRHSVLTENNILQDNQLRHEDTLWSAKLAVAAKRIAASEDKLYCVTFRNGSLMKTVFTDDDFFLWYDTDKRKRYFLSNHGFNEYKKTFDIEHLTWAKNKLSIWGYLKFFKMALNELKSKQDLIIDNNSFLYKHAIMYGIMVFCGVFYEKN